MLSSLKLKKTLPKESKIVHKSKTVHRLARFMTEEAVCLMFGIEWEDIHRIECWQYIVYVHAKGVSKFVSYADFPPILGVTLPNKIDCIKWRRRFAHYSKSIYNKKAPQWWEQFYTEELHNTCEFTSESWNNLLGSIDFAFSESTLIILRELAVNRISK
ncbi:MAG: hypothetical protein AAF208_07670 [Cyanobacteria bacterium P01_A01_bin.45]